MEKNGAQLGKILVTVAFLLVLASISFFDSMALIILIAIFVIAHIRKEEQENLVSLLEAVYLTLVFQIVRLGESAVEGIIKQIVAWAKGNPFGFVNDVFTVLWFIMTIGFAFVAVTALINALAGKPTKTAFVNNLALKSFGLFVAKPTNYYQPQQPYAPTSQQTYAPMPQQEQKIGQPPVQTDAPEWNCSCGRMNTGKFCASCGKSKG